MTAKKSQNKLFYSKKGPYTVSDRSARTLQTERDIEHNDKV